MQKKNIVFIIIAALLPSAIAQAQPKWRAVIPSRSFNHIVVNSDSDIVVTNMGRARAFRSKDGGVTWNTFITRTDTVEYYGCDGQGSHYAKIRGKGICRSDDDGNTWTLILSHDWYFIHGIWFRHDLTIARSGNLYMSTSEQKIGVLRSTNKGTTWTAYNNGIESISTAKVLCSLDSGVLIAQDATMQAYRRREADSAWIEIDWRFPYPWGPNQISGVDHISSSKQGMLIAAGVVAWIYRDSSRTWDYRLRRDSFIMMRNINRSMYDSLGNPYFLSYTEPLLPPFDIYQYIIASKSWQSLRYNIPSLGISIINDLAVLNDGTVFAATDAGLYALKTDLTNVSGNPVYNSLTVDLYPSPAGDAVTLSLCGDQSEDVDVSLCTLLGSVLETFMVKRSDAHERILKICIQDLPAGTYLLNIRGGTKNKVIPLLKK